MTGGVWAEIAGLQDPELRHLAEALPSVVLRSRADSTATKYTYAFQRWRSWAAEHGEVTVFSVSEVHLALYRLHLHCRRNSAFLVSRVGGDKRYQLGTPDARP